jgi:hypothetical protein
VKKVFVLLALTAGACSGTTPTTTTVNPTTVAAVGEALTAADEAALAYVTLPLCVSGGSALCSEAAISAQIKKAAATAYAAYKAAESGSTPALLTAAETALANYSALVPAPAAPKTP